MYEFDAEQFELQDEVAGYYVSKMPQVPIAKYEINDLFQELFNRNVEIRVIDNLWKIFEKIKQTSFNWSMCRMRFAQKETR